MKHSGVLERDLELAKSWFVLAQMCLILAGFLIASSGIVLTNAHNTLMFGIDKTEKLLDKTERVLLEENLNEINNQSLYMLMRITNYSAEVVVSYLEIYKSLWILGAVLIVLSMGFFILGRKKLSETHDILT